MTLMTRIGLVMADLIRHPLFLKICVNLCHLRHLRANLPYLKPCVLCTSVLNQPFS
jgi:hypothetical protein